MTLRIQQLSFVQKDPIRKFLLLSEKAVIEWDITDSYLKISTDKKHSLEEKIENFDRNSLFSDQISHMLSCLEKKKLPINNLASCISSHQTIMSCLKNLTN